jgi:hypothetical protein
LYRLVCVLFPMLASVVGAQTADTNPLEWRERWDNYVERTYNWKRIAIVGAESAFDQTFQLNKCVRAPYCFPRSFGAALARRTTRTTMELGMGALLHEDIRRRPSGLQGFRQRAIYALVHAPLAKGPNGEWRPAYSRFAGTAGAVVVSSAWRGRPLTAGHLTQAFGWSVTNYFQDSVMNEFEPDMKRMAVRWVKKYRKNFF